MVCCHREDKISVSEFIVSSLMSLMGWNTVSGASEFGVCAIVDRVPRFFGRNSSRSDGDM